MPKPKDLTPGLFDLGQSGRFRSRDRAGPGRRRSRRLWPLRRRVSPGERLLAHDWATRVVYSALIAVIVLQSVMVWWISGARL